MNTKVLIIDIHAEMYRDAAARGISRICNFSASTTKAKCRAICRDVDVMMTFGIAIHDYISRRAAAEMDSVAGDRRRSFPALPVAQARRADHQRARHPRPADARGGRLSDDGGQPRRRAAGRRQQGAYLGAPAVEHAARQDRGDRRHRRRRHRHRRVAQGARHARHRRHAHAAPDRRLRRDDPDRPAGRRGAPRRLSDQRAAGERRQYRICSTPRSSPR